MSHIHHLTIFQSIQRLISHFHRLTMFQTRLIPRMSHFLNLTMNVSKKVEVKLSQIDDVSSKDWCHAFSFWQCFKHGWYHTFTIWWQMLISHFLHLTMFQTKVDITCHTCFKQRLRTSAVSPTQSSPCSEPSLATSTSMRSNRQELTIDHHAWWPRKFFHLYLYP